MLLARSAEHISPLAGGFDASTSSATTGSTTTLRRTEQVALKPLVGWWESTKPSRGKLFGRGVNCNSLVTRSAEHIDPLAGCTERVAYKPAGGRGLRNVVCRCIMVKRIL